MKLKTFIAQLQQMYKEIGDVEVVRETDCGDDVGCNTYDVESKPAVQLDTRTNTHTVKIVDG